MSTGFDRDRDDFARGARAIVVYPDLGGSSRDAEARLEETSGLAEAIGVVVVERIAFRVRTPRAATLIGSGQIEDLATRARMEEAGLVVVDGSLTPIQQRNLETALETKVIDRTGLILEIFGERAATAEGRLQVELRPPRLPVRAAGAKLDPPGAAARRLGTLGGPGETQIEADRRLIRDRMARLRRELEQVTRTHRLRRERRQRAPWPVIALVGYTRRRKVDALQSPDRSRRDGGGCYSPTLDPTLRQIALPGIDKAILRYGRLRQRVADPARRGVQGDAGGDIRPICSSTSAMSHTLTARRRRRMSRRCWRRSA
ncbi:hypothetical protein AB5I41_05290 [Sphingomonas sp. MMS24-JH45]